MFTVLDITVEIVQDLAALDNFNVISINFLTSKTFTLIKNRIPDMQQ